MSENPATGENIVENNPPPVDIPNSSPSIPAVNIPANQINVINRPKTKATRAWAWQKRLKECKESVTPNDIVVMASKFRSARDRALFIVLYLTAARVSEVVGTLYKKDITRQEVDFRDIILFRIHNRKNRTRRFKDIPIPYSRESVLLDMLFPYLDILEMESKLFPYSTTRAYQIIKKNTGWNPHWIRHIRLTHLAVYNDFNDQLLVKFAGWTDSRPSKEYMDIKWKDILQKY